MKTRDFEANKDMPEVIHCLYKEVNCPISAESNSERLGDSVISQVGRPCLSKQFFDLLQSMLAINHTKRPDIGTVVDRLVAMRLRANYDQDAQ